VIKKVIKYCQISWKYLKMDKFKNVEVGMKTIFFVAIHSLSLLVGHSRHSGFGLSYSSRLLYQKSGIRK
jgi:hypothetical protein